MKNISILGSTGSIGIQALEVVETTSNFNVVGLSTNTNIDLLEKQIRKFNPLKVAVMDLEKAKILAEKISDLKIQIFSGINGLINIATIDEADIIVMSLVGNIGIEPTYKAILAKKDIALATKEVLVSAGEIIMKEAKKNDINIYPIDSEHSAIFQCLQGSADNKINKIILTASGGPFRGKKEAELRNISKDMALKHPNWSMGAKITIDSSTMMNKGLEVIEAKWLFNIDIDKIEVLVHPQSIVHSAVEYSDGAVLAQMGVADMRVPIAYALTYPKRFESQFEKLDLAKINTLTFEKPDMETFKCLSLAYSAIKIGGSMPAVLNAANEIAVARFLKEEINWLDIPAIIEKTMNAYTVKYDFSIDEILEADKWARSFSSMLKID